MQGAGIQSKTHRCIIEQLDTSDVELEAEVSIGCGHEGHVAEASRGESVPLQRGQQGIDAIAIATIDDTKRPEGPFGGFELGTALRCDLCGRGGAAAPKTACHCGRRHDTPRPARS